MRNIIPIICSLFALSFAGAAFAGAASAQVPPTASPQQVQAMIANGQERAALDDLQVILAAHPESGVAWYLQAEALDASGNIAAARVALANATQYAPGLPFAKPAEVAALQAHLDEATPQAKRAMSPFAVIVVILAGFFVFSRLLRRRRAAPPGFYPGYGAQQPGGPPGPFGYGGQSGGIGSSILTGLAAGAGFAAGARVIDDVIGRSGQAPLEPNNPVADRDDGLNGAPGWDNMPDNSGDFDAGNNW